MDLQSWLRMLVQINTNVVAAALDLIFVNSFLLQMKKLQKNVMIFGAYLSLSMHIDNKRSYLNSWWRINTRIRWYHINNRSLIFTQPNKRFALSLYFNRYNSFLFANAKKTYQFKAKDSEIKDYAWHLGDFSKGFTINYLKKTRLKGNIIFFLLILIPSFESNDILGIQRHLMKGT